MGSCKVRSALSICETVNRNGVMRKLSWLCGNALSYIAELTQCAIVHKAACLRHMRRRGTEYKVMSATSENEPHYVDLLLHEMEKRYLRGP